MKLSSLKRLAQSTTHALGHRMQWGQVYGTPERNALNGRCRDCKAFVCIVEGPDAEPDMSGSAVTVGCTRQSTGD